MSSSISKLKNVNYLFICKLLLLIHFCLNLTCYFNGFNYLTLLCGFFVVIYVIFNYKEVIKAIFSMPYILLFLFLSSYLITFAFHHENLGSAIKTFIWMGIHFYVVFGNYLTDKERNTREFNIIITLFIVIFSLTHFIDIYFLITRYVAIVKSFGGNYNYVGLASWGRLYGVYYDPNYAATMSAVVVILCIYYFFTSEKLSIRLMTIVGVIVNLVYIYFSQSRSALLSYQIGIFLCVLLVFLYRKQFKQSHIILLVCFALLSSFVFPDTTVKIYNKVYSNENHKEDIDQLIDKDVDIIIDDNAEENANTTEDIIGRKDIGDDISNRRFGIWSSGLELFLRHPIIGVGFSDIVNVAQQEIPNTYLINNGYKVFHVFHNTIIDVIVSQGVLGISCVLSLVIYIIIVLFKYIKDSYNIDFLFICVLSSLLCIIVSAMVLSEIYYVNNLCTYIFWLILGYFLLLIKGEMS